jgi:hypothetical protein
MDGGEWTASHPGLFIPRERAPPDIHWVGVWVGPRSSVVTVMKTKKIPGHTRNQILVIIIIGEKINF